MKKFTGKVVLVTGGSRGLGAATAKRFAEEGANVVINYAKHKEEAEKVADAARNSGVKVITFQTDVAVEREVAKMVEAVVKEFGSLDILVNNAGVVFDVPFTEKTTQQWQRTLDVNLNGVYYCTKYAKPHLNKGGSIINIASTNGIDVYHPDSIDYDVSKAGVIMFTKAMARELAPQQVRVNCIAPGWFDTEMNKDLPKDYVNSETSKIAMGRFGRPDEIASVAAFLASEDASYMSGTVVVVDGGYGGAV